MICNQECLYFPEIKNVNFQIVDGVKYRTNSTPYICLSTDKKIIKPECPYFKKRKILQLNEDDNSAKL